MMLGRTNTGGGTGLNFKVVGGTSAPSNPKENTIWVNTDAEITGWHFGAEEPNVYDIKPISVGDPHYLICPHKLSEEDIVNFTIPATVDGVYEALRIHDGSRLWYVRSYGGAAGTAWYAGTKIGLLITETNYPIGEWGAAGTDGSALISAWGSYYHEEGTVWIQTGTTSPMAFNALKKNGIQVCPLSAKQYVGGAWVAKEAKTYQGGAWIDWYDKNARIAELNATGWARYSEGVSGEYVRIGDHGTTRNSTLPAIWCWEDEGTNYWGYCLLATSKSALAVASSTSYGDMASVTSVKTPAGNTLYIGRQASCHTGDALSITSNGETYKLTSKTYAYRHKTGTLDTKLANWADELLFGVR